MRIAIVGAGAVGCYLGARLEQAGNAVTLIGRAEQVEAIRGRGLLVEEADGRAHRVPLRAETAVHERPDLILLTVKSQDVEEACRGLLPTAAGLPVVAMQNGVRADDLAAGVLGRENVLGAVVLCAASYLRPGEVSVEFPGWLVVGEPFGPFRERTRTAMEALNAGVPTFGTRNLVGARWAKLVFNLNNALSAVTGIPLTDLLRIPAARPLPVPVMKEGMRVARALGVRFDSRLHGLSVARLARDPRTVGVALLQSGMTSLLDVLPEAALGRVLSAAGGARLARKPIRGSTWQSLARHRPTEVDYLNGEVVRLGEQVGVPTPLNAHLIWLVHEVERTGAFRPVADLWPAGSPNRFGAEGAVPAHGGASESASGPGMGVSGRRPAWFDRLTTSGKARGRLSARVESSGRSGPPTGGV